MDTSCTIQLFAQAAWHDVGSVSLTGSPEDGCASATYTGYAVDWAIRHPDARDAHAFACGYPVGLEPFVRKHWPVFLIDLLPQGFGRAGLLRQLGRPETAGASADWSLLRVGAANPIGNLRIKEAAEGLAARAGEPEGFTDEEVGQRGEDFAEHIARHGLFVAGSSGVQGEWPKLLLTRAADGLLYLDHSLPDGDAREHYIVKFGRGPNEALARILRHEAPYMDIATALGLKVHAPLRMLERALFIPRFDRRVDASGLTRLAQESIASLTGKAGFGVTLSHDEVCRALVRRCSTPQAEILEYLRRDIANLALGNKDNHARNTALQRDFAGHITLTPLYDFAPMYLHPDGISRCIRWSGNDDSRPNWAHVLDAVCRAAEPQAAERHAPLERATLVEGLRQFAPRLADLAQNGMAMGLEPDVLAHLRPGIERLARELDVLH